MQKPSSVLPRAHDASWSVMWCPRTPPCVEVGRSHQCAQWPTYRRALATLIRNNAWLNRAPPLKGFGSNIGNEWLTQLVLSSWGGAWGWLTRRPPLHRSLKPRLEIGFDFLFKIQMSDVLKLNKWYFNKIYQAPTSADYDLHFEIGCLNWTRMNTVTLLLFAQFI